MGEDLYPHPEEEEEEEEETEASEHSLKNLRAN